MDGSNSFPRQTDNSREFFVHHFLNPVDDRLVFFRKKMLEATLSFQKFTDGFGCAWFVSDFVFSFFSAIGGSAYGGYFIERPKIGFARQLRHVDVLRSGKLPIV